MSTTYCTREDIESLMGKPWVKSCLDDNESGQNSTQEDGYLTTLIEQAAQEINGKIRHQYRLSDVAANPWLKTANAWLACERLGKRRGNGVPEVVAVECEEIRKQLESIRWGREQIPEQSPSFDHRPTVTNFRPELGKISTPVRVDLDETTGSQPEKGIMRKTSNQWGPW
jgi:hypothetical protein